MLVKINYNKKYLKKIVINLHLKSENNKVNTFVIQASGLFDVFIQ